MLVLDMEEVRDLILGKLKYRKCPECDNNGLQYWYNDPTTTHTLEPTRDDSEKNYAIKVDGLYFLLGSDASSLYIC